MMMLETGVGEKRENVKSRRSMGNFGGDKRTKQGDEILMCCAVLPAEGSLWAESRAAKGVYVS